MINWCSQVLTAPAYSSLVAPLMSVVAYESGIDVARDALVTRAQVSRDSHRQHRPQREAYRDRAQAGQTTKTGTETY